MAARWKVADRDAKPWGCMIGGYDRMSAKGPVPPMPALVAGAPFALLVGRPWQTVSRSRAEEALMRMGLRPCLASSPDQELGQPCFRVFFGDTSILMGPASDTWLSRADPQDPKNSKIGVVVPDDWRRAGHVWHFRPEGRAVLDDGGDFYKMMLLLLDVFGATHLYWDAAALWSDAKMFRAAMREFLISAMPPVLHMVAFRKDADHQLYTRGLHYFAGQELAATIPAEMDVQAVVRRLARLALDVMMNGPYRTAMEVAGLDPGEVIWLYPEAAVGNQPAIVRAEILPQI